MKLKAGLTYWTQANQPPPHYAPLRRNVNCDVAIIGGGITGALVAHALVKAGKRVVLVDRRPPGTGSTSASTALLLYDTDTSLAELARRHGQKNAFRVYALGKKAVRELGQIARSGGRDCGYAPRKSLYLASDAAGFRQLKREYALRRKAGFPTTWLNRVRLRRQFGLDFPGAIYSPGSARVDAMRLTQTLMSRDVRRRKLRVFQGTKIVRVTPNATGVELHSAGHHLVRAKHVIAATGYEAAPFLPARLVKLNSSYVIASQPQPGKESWHDDCLIWETARPYFYMRTTSDHRILMGGEDEPFADPARRDAKIATKARRLQRRFRELFPNVPFEIEYAWTGTFGESPDGLPYIGAKAGSPRVLYALGYGGNGITFSQIAATILTRICLGQRVPDAKLFRFDR